MSDKGTWNETTPHYYAVQNAELKRANATLAARVRELERENEVLRMIIDVIDTRTPVADETCDEPGICVSEAARRELADMGKIAYDYRRVQP